MVEELRQRGLRLDLAIDERRKTKDAFILPASSFVITGSLEEALNYGPFDAAIFALKSFDTESVLEGMAPFASKLPPIVCFSNGVDNESMLAGVIGADKVIPGTVTSAIGRRGAGDIVLEKLRGIGIADGYPVIQKAGIRIQRGIPQGGTFSECGCHEVVENADQPGRQSHLSHP